MPFGAKQGLNGFLTLGAARCSPKIQQVRGNPQTAFLPLHRQNVCGVRTRAHSHDTCWSWMKHGVLWLLSIERNYITLSARLLRLHASFHLRPAHILLTAAEAPPPEQSAVLVRHRIRRFINTEIVTHPSHLATLSFQSRHKQKRAGCSISRQLSQELHEYRERSKLSQGAPGKILRGSPFLQIFSILLSNVSRAHRVTYERFQQELLNGATIIKGRTCLLTL